jgi:hypothetical protein
MIISQWKPSIYEEIFLVDARFCAMVATAEALSHCQ